MNDESPQEQQYELYEAVEEYVPPFELIRAYVWIFGDPGDEQD